MDNLTLDGEVYVNGKLHYRGVYPDIDSRGLSIWRREADQSLQVHRVGPHFYLKLPTLNFIRDISRELIQAPMRYSIQGTSLGEVEYNIGSPDREFATRIMDVNLLELNMRFENKILLLNVSGNATDTTAWVKANDRLEPMSFEIKCPIPLALISNVFRGPVWEMLRLQGSFERESDEDFWEFIVNTTRKEQWL